jgi:hypothetical protein
MQPPASRFVVSPRAYHRVPPAWEYAPGSDVHRVHSQGSVWYGTRRFFVSEALAGEDVACGVFKRRVLITYRQMLVRELHLGTGRSVPLWQPV